MRLDKFISNNTQASRSDVRRLIRADAVKVNGIGVRNAATQILPDDRVTLDDAAVVPAGNVYYMLHKPAGVICANRDSAHPTVLDLLNPTAGPATHQDLQIAGRLDLDTTGLVLITNDGQWNHRVTSPHTACCKVYRVTLQNPFDPGTRETFTKGMQLDREKKLTRPATIEVVSPATLLLTIQEGKYHQVKRMFAATGNKVVSLHRISIGKIALDPTLAPGQYRPLTSAEIDSVLVQSARR